MSNPISGSLVRILLACSFCILAVLCLVPNKVYANLNLFNLGIITVNITDHTELGVLRTIVYVEVSPKHLKQAKASLPAVRDVLISCLSYRSFHELTKTELRESLKRTAINEINARIFNNTNVVQNLYFTEFVIGQVVRLGR